MICGQLRCWRHRKGLALNADDVKYCWVQTLEAVKENVEAGVFREEGRLDAYLRTIARRKAIDLIRRLEGNRSTGLVRRATRLDHLPAPVQPPHMDPELIQQLEARFENMAPKLRMVIRVDLQLCLAGGGTWASLEELTAEINKEYGLDLPASTIKARRPRAREELRRILGEGGDGE